MRYVFYFLVDVVDLVEFCPISFAGLYFTDCIMLLTIDVCIHVLFVYKVKHLIADMFYHLLYNISFYCRISQISITGRFR